jgi:hypothetical protein
MAVASLLLGFSSPAHFAKEARQALKVNLTASSM